MLDTDTKRRIDTARDILVGKVPDPKSQVEQITIALIYKFMDDMDAHAEELGGHRKFFAGDFARYGWAKLMRAGLGGQEVLNLYAEAIAKMPENPGIPLLFRNIFRNAYLPYRDPETLKSFLKIIDDFTYDHSERLGDAFEYLLSVLGSQGDAGQFRTPRHIIDFIVDIVDPKKNETILDPACGTAGFLISAYKHIVRANSDEQGRSKLTPDEKGRLAKNIHGYDISPDMVRLSLVNLYLHGFTDPHIDEYDTLTSEDKWNETADVILANPPFMSPKGGIKPHRRFSVQSKRSEVLFVDYMAEHLSPTGRAGIIVPEGIIFQSQGAYTELRKMLVEKYLIAVISLPAGVFNPYSGVKTSVLILDKSLARQSDTIGFFKVENDGFGLGAQRREINKNDLPQVKAELDVYFETLRNHLPTVDMRPAHGLIVPKTKIAANGDYNLSGERYRVAFVNNAHFPLVSLVDVASLIRGITFGTSDQLDSTLPDSLAVVTTKAAQASGIVEKDAYYIPRRLLRDDAKLLREGDILISTANSLSLLGRTTPVNHLRRPTSFGAFMSAIRPNQKILDSYLIRCLRTPYAADFFIRSANTTTNISNLNLSALANFQVPLPPLDVQKEIVAEIEGYQKVIDGARAVLDNYRPHIPIHPDWPLAELGEVCDVRDGTHDSPRYVLDGYPLITSKNLRDGFIDFTDANLISRDDLDAINKRSKVDAGDLLMPMIGTIGNPVIADESREYAVKNVALIKFPEGCRMVNRFLKDILDSAAMQSLFERQSSGSTQRFISLGLIRKLQVPVPPLANQEVIVAEIQAEQSLVASNRELVARFEKKIQATLARVWGEEKTAAPEA